MTRDSSYQPQTLSVSVGAGMGDGFDVTLEHGRLTYVLSDSQAGATEETVVTVSSAGWRSFRRSLDRLGAAGWSGRFEPPEADMRTDGVAWSIQVVYTDGLDVVCHGYDAYPPNGTANEFSKPFEQFCRAVSRLLGGLEFGWEVAKPPEPKGSRLRMREWVHDHREQLECELCRQVPSLGDFVNERGSSINWIAPDSEGKEIRDGLWPLVLPGPTPQQDGFWPAGGPVWDAAGLAAGRDGAGIVLIEAKAHTAELLSPRMHPSSSNVNEQRRTALNEAKAAYGVDPSVPWTMTYYQLANRLAFLYYLRVRRKQPAWLINLYFYGDSFTSGGREVVGPKDPAGWVDALTDAKRALGVSADHALREYAVDVFLPATLSDPGSPPPR